MTRHYLRENAMKMRKNIMKKDCDINYSKEDILAIIVTFNCNDIQRNIDSLLLQVAKVLIIDNHSEEPSLHYLNSIVSNDISVIYLEKNIGQAAALNYGLSEASRLGFKLLLTMDQDSILDKNCVRTMLSIINLGIDAVGPNYRHLRNRSEFWEVRYLITSGNLIRVDALNTINGYNDILFIDSVDFDVSLRLRGSGYRLAMARDAHMCHSIGEKYTNRSGKDIYEHSLQRHYTIARNHYYVTNKYFNVDPLFCIKLRLVFFRYLLGVQKERESKQKYALIKAGKKEAKKLL